MALLILVLGVIITVLSSTNTKPSETAVLSVNMRLSSSAFENEEFIPRQYTCDGANVNPPLNIGEVPPATESLVLIVDDPDAPGGDWTHWTVWNINPAAAVIGENSVPAGAVEGLTNFGKPGYGGPCPPSGAHHYQFKLYALDRRLTLSASANKVDLEKAMAGNIVAEARLVGLYQR